MSISSSTPHMARPLGFFDAVAMTLVRSLDYGGRSSRLEFSCWLGFCVLFCAAMLGLLMLLGGDNASTLAVTVTLACGVLGCTIPGLPLGLRRLHDLGRRGIWLFALLATAVLAILAGVWLVFVLDELMAITVSGLGLAVIAAALAAGSLMPSQPGTNRFGPPPRDEVGI